MPYKWIYAAIDENKKFAFIHSFYHYISLSALLCSFTKRVSSIQDITDKLRDNESLFSLYYNSMKMVDFKLRVDYQ